MMIIIIIYFSHTHTRAHYGHEKACAYVIPYCVHVSVRMRAGARACVGVCVYWRFLSCGAMHFHKL